MDDFYREMILDHCKNPRNKGTLDPHDICYEDDNPLCGDRIRMTCAWTSRTGSARWPLRARLRHSQASASLLTEEIKGKTLDEMKQIGKETSWTCWASSLGPVRLKCALLSLKVLKAGAYGLKGWPASEDEA